MRAEVVDEPPEEASNEELASPDGDESWRDEIVADIFDGPRPPKPETPFKDYGDFIAQWVDEKRARDLEERAQRRRAGQVHPRAHVCARDEEVEAPDLGPNVGPPSG